MTEVMKKALIIGVVISTVALAGCYYYGPCLDGSGPVIGEVRSISDFTGVSNTGSFDVYVTQSDEFYVEVVAQENLIPIIETYVSGYTLIIKTENGSCYRSSSPIEVHVSLPELEMLRLSGSGKVYADVAETQVFECSNAGSGSINIDSVIAESFSLSNAGSGSVDVLESYVNELTMIQSGSGSINGGVVYESNEVNIRHSASGRMRSTIIDGTVLNAILSGSGKIDLSGETSVADFTINSSGRIDALELMATDVEATSTGSGNIFVYATELLKATITGSGDIIYRGNPTISFQITGSGSLRPY
jgi:hypothetical protein